MTDANTAALDKWLQKEADAYRAARKCDYCGEPIWDDYYYQIGNDEVCERCLVDYFRRSNIE